MSEEEKKTNMEEKEGSSGKKSEKKEDFDSLKKTVEAHGTLSEEDALKKAEKAEEVSKEVIDKEAEKEKAEEDTDAEKKIEKLEKSDKEEKELTREERERKEITAAWEPKTKLGRDVKNGVVKSLDEIIESNKKILESEIVDYITDVKTDLILVGQAKGKFGGGKRRAWRQTQRKTKEGNVPTFSTMAVVGDENGHVGIGSGEASETLPARDKAIRKAKLNIIKVKRDCSDFDCTCGEPHTVPFKVEGKEGSCRVVLIPAAQGTGLVAGGELKKILKFAGIKDIYSKSFGTRKTTFNFVKACFNALKKTNLKVNRG
ncbi:MAG: 30S ribosomal protein S5 [Candidatus Pacearchaeota archaeon]